MKKTNPVIRFFFVTFVLEAFIITTELIGQGVEDLSYWSGKIGNETIKLFLTGPAFPANYIPTSGADTMFDNKHKNAVSGYYFYDKNKAILSLIGTTMDGRWKFEEHNGSICTKYKPNGYLDGYLAGDTVSGIWVSADSSKHLPFLIKKTPFLKRTVFGWLSGGEWALHGAEGICSANTFTNLRKDEQGRWRAHGSAPNGPEGWDYLLSGEEKRIVDGTRIQVTDSLELVVNVNDKEVLRISYLEDPIFTIRQTTTEIDRTGPIYEYQRQPGLTLTGVNIATTDIGKFDVFLRIDALPYNIPSVAHIEYTIIDDLFHITLLSKDCCANQDLTFKRLPASMKN
jgi:hypothetical protein